MHGHTITKAPVFTSDECFDDFAELLGGCLAKLGANVLELALRLFRDTSAQKLAFVGIVHG
jgi:hypothetical protein